MDASQSGSSNVAQLIWMIGTPVIFTFGVVGNIITIIVLTKKKHRKTSTAVYLILLALADLLTIVTLLPRWWIIYMFDYDIRKSSNIVCKLHWFMVFFFPGLSDVALTVVTLERVISTIKPHKVRLLCNTKSAMGVSFIVTFFLFCLSVHLVYGFSLEVSEDSAEIGDDTRNNTFGNSTLPFYHNTTTFATQTKDYVCLSTHDKVYMWFYSKVYVWIRIATCTVLVQVVFIIGGIIIIRVLIRSRNMHKTNESICSQSENRYNRRSVKASNHSTQITITLLSVNVAYFFLRNPLMIFLLGKPSWIGTDTRMNELQEILWASFNMLYYLNHAINFVLYFLSGRKFRADVVALFRCYKRPVPDHEISVNSALSISQKVSMMYSSVLSGNELTSGSQSYTEYDVNQFHV